MDETPENPELHYLYGIALRRTGEPGIAVWSLERASQSADWHLPASIELAGAALWNQSFPLAIRAASSVLEVEPDHVTALLLRGAAHLGQRTHPELALADFERVLELDPDSREARIQRVSALLLLKETERAIDALSSLAGIEGDPNIGDHLSAQLCAARAIFAVERGELEDARALFESCLREHPSDWTVVHEASLFFEARGDAERVEDLLRTALRARPGSVAVRGMLADRLRLRGELERSESLLRQGTVLEDPAAASQAWAALATFQLQRARYAEAARSYEKALENDPEPSQQRLLDYADLLALAGRHEEALEVADGFESSIYRDLIHARVLLARDQPRSALERLDAANRLWPNNAAARYYAARAAEQLGRYDRAAEEYRQSIRSGADQTDAPVRLARLLAATGQKRAAVTAIGYRLKNRPDDPYALLFALELADELRDPEQAAGFLELAKASPEARPRALAIWLKSLARDRGPEYAVDRVLAEVGPSIAHPRNAPLLQALIPVMAELGRLPEAEAILDRGGSDHAESAAVLATRGFLLEVRGSPEGEARAAYQAALAADPDYVFALDRLARLEASEGEIDRAILHFDRASQLAPNVPDPAREAALLLRDAGRTTEAKHRLEALLREHPFDAAAADALSRLRTEGSVGEDRAAERSRTRAAARRPATRIHSLKSDRFHHA